MPAKKETPDKPQAEPKAPKAPEPHEVNDMLASDRMQALLADHRRMGTRE